MKYFCMESRRILSNEINQSVAQSVNNKSLFWITIELDSYIGIGCKFASWDMIFPSFNNFG